MPKKKTAVVQLDAHRAFSLNISRLLHLLDAGTAGIKGQREQIEALHSKFAKPLEAEVSDGEKTLASLRPSSKRKKLVQLRDRFAYSLEHKDDVAISKHAALPNFKTHEDGDMSFSLDRVEAEIIAESMSVFANFVGDLDHYFHNILCVAAWGAFEGYIQSVLTELFVARPDLLASDKTILVREVIDARAGLIEFLISREIDDVGRKGFADLQSYLRSKVQLQFGNAHFGPMRDLYFVRNVVAHNAGYLRRDQLRLVPPKVDVKDSQIRLSREYVHEAVECLQGAVDQFHPQLASKWMKAENHRSGR